VARQGSACLEEPVEDLFVGDAGGDDDDEAAAGVVLGDAPAVGDGTAEVVEDADGLGSGAVLDADLDRWAGEPGAQGDVGAAGLRLIQPFLLSTN
jgi:hypothetical protein